MSDLNTANDYVDQLISLLTASNTLPTIKPPQLPGAAPHYIPATNTVVAPPRALGHELLHALQFALNSAATDIGNKNKPLAQLQPKVLADLVNLLGGPGGAVDSKYAPVSLKLSLAPSTVAVTPRMLAERLAPKWAAREADYRATNLELMPFEVPAPGQPPNTFGAPGHLGPTLRTELEIALELLSRNLLGGKRR